MGAFGSLLPHTSDLWSLWTLDSDLWPLIVVQDVEICQIPCRKNSVVPQHGRSFTAVRAIMRVLLLVQLQQ
jgi:hypothetical protein